MNEQKNFYCKFANVHHIQVLKLMEQCTALIKPGDTILGMSLNSGGASSHGLNQLNPENGLKQYITK